MTTTFSWLRQQSPTRRRLSGVLAAMTFCLFAAGQASAVDAASAAGAAYRKERADCDAGRSAEDRATCLKEAGAAKEERQRSRLDTGAATPQNATDRCNALPARDKTDCLARMQGASGVSQRTTTSGSVAGGGVLRETTTTVPASAPAK